MKLIGKIVTFVVMLALVVSAGINTYIHIKSGEIKNLLPNTQVEQSVEANSESPAKQ